MQILFNKLEHIQNINSKVIYDSISVNTLDNILKLFNKMVEENVNKKYTELIVKNFLK